MASTKGGQRLTVAVSHCVIVLNAVEGIDLIQSGSSVLAGTGAGITPSSSAGQRKIKFNEASLPETSLIGAIPRVVIKVSF
jgi:hypothetical protein